MPIEADTALYGFNVLGTTKVISTGSTVISAQLGVTDGEVSGFPPGVVLKQPIHVKDETAVRARQNAVAIFNNAISRTPNYTYTSINLGGMFLKPGIHEIDGKTQLSGELTLNGENNRSAIFIFHVKGDLEIQNSATITRENPSNSASANVFWIVDGDVTVGASADLFGNIIAKGTITLGDNTSLIGRVVSLEGEVRLTNNQISVPADLEVTISRTKGRNEDEELYVLGEKIIYTIKANNKGPIDEADIRVTNIQFPGNVESYSSTVGQTYDSNTGTWEVGTLQYEEVATLTIVTVVNKSGNGSVSASIVGGGTDEIYGNNYFADGFCIMLGEAGAVTGDTELCAGTTAEYSIEDVPGATGYNWKVPAGWTVTGSGTKVSITAGTESGSIRVAVINICGELVTPRLPVTVFPDVPAKPGTITGPANVCINETNTPVTYTIEPVERAKTYTWTLPTGWTMVADNGTSVTVVPGGDNTVKSLTVVASNICGDSEPTTFQIQPFLKAPAMPGPISGLSSVCATTTSTTYEVAAQADAISYTWTVPDSWKILTGEGTNIIEVEPSAETGTISVKAVNSCGESPARTFTVASITAPPAAPLAISGATTVCSGGSNIEYSVEGDASVSEYYWYVPTGWTIISGQRTRKIIVAVGTSGGKIIVQAKNDCGVGGSKSIEVSTLQNAPATPLTIKGTEYGCANNTPFTYRTDPVPGASSYNWTVPEGWQIISGHRTTTITVLMGATAGNVTVSASNACGVSEPKALWVQPSTTPPIKPYGIIGETRVCVGQEGIVFSLNPVDNTLEYIWAVPDGWTITSGQGTTTITVTAGASSGSITVSASNDCGASLPAQLQVAPTADPPVTPVAINGSTRVCVGQQGVVYAVDPVPGAATYIWEILKADGSGTATDWRINSGQLSNSVNVTAGTTEALISVVAVNACGQQSPAKTVAIVFRAPPAPAVSITGEAVPCMGFTYTYAVNDVPDASNYVWELPEGWQIIGANDGKSITVKPSSTGGRIRVAAANSCGTSDFVSMVVNPSTDIPVTPGEIQGGADACVNGVITYSIAAVSNARSYKWVVPAGWQIMSGQGTVSISVKVGASGGTISVATENDCGEGTPRTKAVTTSTAPPAKPGIITGDIQVCRGSNQVYTIEPVNGAVSYNWTFPEGWEIVAGQDTRTVTVKAGSVAGTVTVTAQNGCGTNTGESLAVVPVEGAPAKPKEIINNNGNFCGGTDNLVFRIPDVATATSYTWLVPAGWQITAGQGTTQITVKAGTTSGQVTVVASNACGQGETSSLAVAPQAPLVAPLQITGPAYPCNQNSTAVYSVSEVAGADHYLWSLPSGWTIISGEGTSKIEVVVVGAGGAVSVKAGNTCGYTTEISLEVQTVSEAPIAPANIEGDLTICASTTATYSVEPSATAISYTWTLPTGWQIISGEGTSEITVKVGSASGEISVSANNNCGSSTSTVKPVVSVPMIAISSIIDRSSPCTGLVYEVASSSGAVDYVWNVPAGWVITSGQGTTRITVTPGEGTGVITVAANNGICLSEPMASLTPDLNLLNSGIVFPNVFTPNNDGNNDTWEIESIMNFPDNDITVINRWGSEVFRSKSYKNGWTGDNLSEGTYYYIARVKLCDGTDKVFKGYVMIVR
ncbi:ice-binding family protein [Pontibacter harenae]|uniref:ice-binding family protein n=1 Tax=Pontibacter harenae TaxID=2894083 RepID=UPI001E5FF588|nr:ice-binding family protein [Pontibacter harenae]MCC9167355.1 ice-binding family protein [Pontibacter harenae]